MIINYSDKPVIEGQKAIFLAGPTPRKEGEISWRIEACKFLEENGFDGVVHVPEYSSWKPRGELDDQANWERKSMENSSIIVFWVPRVIPDMLGLTTNLEIGYWIHTGRVIYGRPDSAAKIKYVDWIYKLDMEMEPYNNIEDLLLAAISKANEIGTDYPKEVLPVQKRIIMK